MKTTMTTRSIANPQRTTLAHLEDASELMAAAGEGAPEAEVDEFPASLANPRRTVLKDLPV